MIGTVVGFSLKIASYNIHRCFGTDREYSPERIAEVIRGLNVDMVALQEVDMRLLADHRPQLEYLADAVGMTAIAGACDHRGQFGNALLTRLPIQEVRRVDLSIRRFEPRGAIDARLQLGDLRLRVVATHLGLNAAERRLQVRHLLQSLGDSAMPSIIMGDFNEWRPVRGALQALDRRFGTSLPLRTFPSRFPMLPLDRIWAWPHPGLRRVRAHASALARLASDHLPIRAELFWEEVDLTTLPGMVTATAKG